MSCVLGLFWKIHLMDPYTYAPLFIAGTLVATYLVSFAYKNTKFTMKHKYLFYPYLQLITYYFTTDE